MNNYPTLIHFLDCKLAHPFPCLQAADVGAILAMPFVPDPARCEAEQVSVCGSFLSDEEAAKMQDWVQGALDQLVTYFGVRPRSCGCVAWAQAR